MFRLDQATNGMGQTRARQSSTKVSTGQDRAGQGKAGRGREGQDGAGQGRAGQQQGHKPAGDLAPQSIWACWQGYMSPFGVSLLRQTRIWLSGPRAVAACAMASLGIRLLKGHSGQCFTYSTSSWNCLTA